jgi:N-acetylglutamate synthase/N-acetylornithine aminotransferase
MVEATEKALQKQSLMATGKPRTQAVVMSTGVIGQRLDMKKICTGIEQLCQQLDSTEDAWVTDVPVTLLLMI